tara:strand:+ start:1823 stop:2239 length:417 start_codon:yes stop_codon:yes gene_type:complete
MREVDAAYIAGLFDGEGSVDFAKRKEKRNGREYICQRISMRIEMTDQSILRWIHEVLKIGTVRKRNRSPSVKEHWKDRWTYTVRFREAYLMSCIIWPFVHVKMESIQRIIDHYSSRKLRVLNDKVVSLDEYREAMSLE